MTEQNQAISLGSQSNPLRRLYDWVIGWAETRHSQTALFLIAFAEASFFPIPPDVLLIAMGVGAPKKALRFAGICLLGSVMGGIMGYFIGMSLWSVTSEYFFTYVPGFSQAVFEKVSAIFHEHAFMSVFMAGLTPIPYKVFTIAAGVAELSFAIFVGASVCSRGIRFFAIGGCLKVFGPSVKQLIDKYFNWFSILFFVLLVSGFVVVKKLI